MASTTFGKVGPLVFRACATGRSWLSAENREAARAASRFRIVVNNVVVNPSEDRLLFS